MSKCGNRAKDVLGQGARQADKDAEEKKSDEIMKKAAQTGLPKATEEKPNEQRTSEKRAGSSGSQHSKDDL